jgi:hypothetical protein
MVIPREVTLCHIKHKVDPVETEGASPRVEHNAWPTRRPSKKVKIYSPLCGSYLLLVKLEEDIVHAQLKNWGTTEMLL